MYYVGWRNFNGGGVDWLQVVFWAIFPDLAAFVPIAITSERTVWPSWGGDWYNLFHIFLIWGAVFAGFWLVIGAPYVPLLGWLLHITTDRATGYYLRANEM